MATNLISIKLSWICSQQLAQHKLHSEAAGIHPIDRTKPVDTSSDAYSPGEHSRGLLS